MKKISSLGRFSLVFFLLFLLVGSGWFLNQPVDPEGEEKIFVVRPKEDTRQIASRLEEEGLIKNSYFFLFSLWQQKLWGKVQAGTFRLSPQMSTATIAQHLTKGRIDQWLRIIEGVRREEIAFQVEEELGLARKEFLQASEGWEGYLFPDSYLVPLNTSAVKLVEIMVKNFRRRTKNLWPLAQKKGLSEKEVLILASLVEREAKTKDDRILVAGILLKRWKNKWPLQVDATVQYAKASLSPPEGKKGWWPLVSGQDLSLKSPFNTYLHLGLPPAPICNPSLESLEAVVESRQTPFWFYLSDRQGKVHFARTLAEHQLNVEKYLKTE